MSRAKTRLEDTLSNKGKLTNTIPTGSTCTTPTARW